MEELNESESEALYYIYGFLTEAQWRQAMDEFEGTSGEALIKKARRVTYDRYSITYPDEPKGDLDESDTDWGNGDGFPAY